MRVTDTAGGVLAAPSVHSAPSLFAACAGDTVPGSERGVPAGGIRRSDPTLSVMSPAAAPVATSPETDVSPAPGVSAVPALVALIPYAAITEALAPTVVAAFTSTAPSPLEVVAGVNGTEGASRSAMLFAFV